MEPEQFDLMKSSDYLDVFTLLNDTYSDHYAITVHENALGIDVTMVRRAVVEELSG